MSITLDCCFSTEKLVKGDIKLGFMITKGQLEVDVICAKGLTLTTARQPPGEL